ncbi:MAG: hypothetical protein H7301_01000 [Cryobacterium sp.]|nr:hypothetical protein [Oligoflexia bacterium]
MKKAKISGLIKRKFLVKTAYSRHDLSIAPQIFKAEVDRTLLVGGFSGKLHDRINAVFSLQPFVDTAVTVKRELGLYFFDEVTNVGVGCRLRYRVPFRFVILGGFGDAGCFTGLEN